MHTAPAVVWRRRRRSKQSAANALVPLACPSCGAVVEPVTPRSTGSEARECPRCRTQLRRAPGELWKIDGRPEVLDAPREDSRRA